MQEQRKFKRSKVVFDVIVRAHGHEERASGRDLSIGGVFIECQTPLPFGTPLEITFTLPGSSEAMNLPAVSRWVSKTGMGIQFGLFGARVTYQITEFLKKQEQDA
jgi:hypothetical protein